MGNFFADGGAAHMSDRTDWGTPQDLFNQLHDEFRFTVDVCASAWNAKLPRYFTEEDDGLAQDWSSHRCFMNPPYGRDVARWIRKAANEALRGALVVALIPARTDTRWWHDYIEGVAEVRFLRGRLRYVLPGGPADPAPFPSCVVIWRGGS